MRTGIFFCLLLSFVSCKRADSTKAKRIDQEKYFAVTSQSGLILRDQPQQASKKLAILPYKYRGEIIERTQKIENIQKAFGFWFKTQYNNQVGWVFSGFVLPLATIDSPLPPEIVLRLEDTYDLIYDPGIETLTESSVTLTKQFEPLPNPSTLLSDYEIFHQREDPEDSMNVCDGSRYVFRHKKTGKSFEMTGSLSDVKIIPAFFGSNAFFVFRSFRHNCRCGSHYILNIVYPVGNKLKRITLGELGQNEKLDMCGVSDNYVPNYSLMRFDKKANRLYIHSKSPICQRFDEMDLRPSGKITGALFSVDLTNLNLEKADKQLSIEIPASIKPLWESSQPP